MPWRFALFQCLPLIFANLLCAQQPLQTLSFEQSFPGSDPEHFVITLTSDCKATYQSNGKLADQSASGDSYRYDFVMTESNCTKLFDLTKRAHYFESDISSKKKNMAAMGIKTLSYKDNQKTSKATYNYSPLPEVQELTARFQALGSTIEFGRRLEYDHHYQKLALDEDIKRMQENLSATGGLDQIPAIFPILQKIVDDPSLMNMVRSRAQRLLAGETLRP